MRSRMIGLGIGMALLMAAIPASSGAGGPVRCAGRPATFIGDGGSNTIEGTPGRDVIHGRGGSDIIDGRGGNDII